MTDWGCAFGLVVGAVSGAALWSMDASVLSIVIYCCSAVATTWFLHVVGWWRT